MNVFFHLSSHNLNCFSIVPYHKILYSSYFALVYVHVRPIIKRTVRIPVHTCTYMHIFYMIVHRMMGIESELVAASTVAEILDCSQVKTRKLKETEKTMPFLSICGHMTAVSVSETRSLLITCKIEWSPDQPRIRCQATTTVAPPFQCRITILSLISSEQTPLSRL